MAHWRSVQAGEALFLRGTYPPISIYHKSGNANASHHIEHGAFSTAKLQMHQPDGTVFEHGILCKLHICRWRP